MSPILEDQTRLSPKTPSKGKHPTQNSALRQVHTDTGHLKHRRDPKALTTDTLDPKHGQTLLLNNRKAPRPGLETAKRREKHQGELRAEVRGNKDHCVFHDSGKELRLSRDNPYDCSNHHQLHRQRRERYTRASRRATKKKRW
uniref:Uncharacterized protein n=1 Tax=Oryza rufipogon TaxID=4529 RepID=A0A0E0NF82_ORYRU